MLRRAPWRSWGPCQHYRKSSHLHHEGFGWVPPSVGSKFFECSENNYSFPEHIFARSAKKNFLLRSTKNVLRNTKNMLRSDPGAPKTCSGTQSHALSLSKFPGSLPNPTKSCSGAPHCSKTCSGADVTSGALPIIRSLDRAK